MWMLRTMFCDCLGIRLLLAAFRYVVVVVVVVVDSDIFCVSNIYTARISNGEIPIRWKRQQKSGDYRTKINNLSHFTIYKLYWDRHCTFVWLIYIIYVFVLYFTFVYFLSLYIYFLLFNSTKCLHFNAQFFSVEVCVCVMDLFCYFSAFLWE